MKTYVINLNRAPERKSHMKKILSGIKNIELEWIEAVDGKNLNIREINEVFDTKKFKNKYRRYPRPGEIGCILSHRKCFTSLLNSNSDYALILEDDIFFRQINCDLSNIIQKSFPINYPTVLLLSGWFWYTRKKKIYKDFEICNVYDARLAQSYVINRRAAELILSEKPWSLADDWGHVRKRKIKILSVIPHITEQNFQGSFNTYISDTSSPIIRGNYISLIKERLNAIPRRLLKITGRFYPYKG